MSDANGSLPISSLAVGICFSDLLTWLAKKENLSPEQLESLLNKKSGLLGLSGCSDMRDVLKAIGQGDADAKRATEIFCYRVRKYIGAYFAVLSGVDGIIFGGGVGEHMPFIRENILQQMDWCGIRLDPLANANVVGTEQRISEEKSSVPVWVIPVDEAALIARNVLEQTRSIPDHSKAPASFPASPASAR